jgi:hypothetical protein
MHTMHLLPGVAKQPNLELKTRPKQLLGSLPLVIVLPASSKKLIDVIQSLAFSADRIATSLEQIAQALKN